MEKTLPETPIEALQDMLADAGTQRALSALLEIDTAHLCRILSGEQAIPKRILEKLGFEKRVMTEIVRKS